MAAPLFLPFVIEISAPTCNNDIGTSTVHYRKMQIEGTLL